MPSNRPPDLELPADATAPRIARRHSAHLVRGWRLPGVLDSVVLITSELVTNAVRYGKRPILLGLSRDAADVRIEVHDANPEMGAVYPAAVTSESGRGRHIVEKLASDCGVVDLPGDGKVVWAVVSDPVSDTVSDAAPAEG